MVGTWHRTTAGSLLELTPAPVVPPDASPDASGGASGVADGDTSGGDTSGGDNTAGYRLVNLTYARGDLARHGDVRGTCARARGSTARAPSVHP